MIIDFYTFSKCQLLNEKHRSFLLKYLKYDWKTATQLKHIIKKEDYEDYVGLVNNWKYTISELKNIK